jgi:hypothetical protein
VQVTGRNQERSRSVNQKLCAPGSVHHQSFATDWFGEGYTFKNWSISPVFIALDGNTGERR